MNAEIHCQSMESRPARAFRSELGASSHKKLFGSKLSVTRFRSSRIMMCQWQGRAEPSQTSERGAARGIRKHSNWSAQQLVVQIEVQSCFKFSEITNSTKCIIHVAPLQELIYCCFQKDRPSCLFCKNSQLIFRPTPYVEKYLAVFTWPTYI